MKKYYIFAIDKNLYNVYKSNTEVLFETLNNLYNLDIEYVNYGISIYNQLCVPINKEVLEAYYKDYRYIKNHFRIGNSIMEINNSCIIILTNSNLKATTCNLNYYNNPLFACNFNEREYCFLN